MADTWNPQAASKVPSTTDTPDVSRSSKSYVKKTISSVDNGITPGQGSARESKTILKYPLSDNNYPASVTFGLKRIKPLNVDQQTAERLMNEPFFTDGNSSKVSVSEETVKISDRPAVSTTRGGPPNRDLIGRTAKEKEAITNREVSNRVADKKRGEIKGDPDLGAKIEYVKPLKLVQMYFPMGVTFQDNVAYENVNLGPGGATTMAAINAGANMAGSIAQGVTEGAASLFDAIKTGPTTDVAKVAIARGVRNRLVSEGVQQGVKLGLQVSMNPNTRSMFNGVNLRNFSFQFKFIPTSQREAVEVQNIIQLFREELYPDPIYLGSVPVGYKFPNLFEIKFKWRDRENETMPQPLLCYLRDVTTNYTPTTTAFHEDGRAQEVDMTLQFTEYRTLNREDVEAGH